MAIFGIIGSILYNRMYNNYSFRKIMTITNIATITTSLLNVLLIYSRDISINVVYTIRIIWCIFFGFFSIQQFLWLSTNLSKNCQTGKESITLSVYFGIFNLSLILGTYVSDQYYIFYLNYIGSEKQFEFFDIYYFGLAFVLPLIMTFSLCFLIDTKTEKDDFSENVEKPNDTEISSII